MLYFALRAFGFLITNINIKITIYYSPQRLSFSILSVLFHFSFIHLPAVFAPYFSPFPSLLLSHFDACVRSSASPPAPSLSLLLPSHSCSLSSRPHLCISPSFFSLTYLHTLSPFYCTSILLFSVFSLTICLCPSTFLFTFSLYIFSPGRLLLLSFF
jgi:hypothetical protein